MRLAAKVENLTWRLRNMWSKLGQDCCHTGSDNEGGYCEAGSFELTSQEAKNKVSVDQVLKILEKREG